MTIIEVILNKLDRHERIMQALHDTLIAALSIDAVVPPDEEETGAWYNAQDCLSQASTLLAGLDADKEHDRGE